MEAKREAVTLRERYERRTVIACAPRGNEFNVLAPRKFVDDLERLFADFRPTVSRFAFIVGDDDDDDDDDHYSRLGFAERHRPQVKALIERFKNLDA